MYKDDIRIEQLKDVASTIPIPPGLLNPSSVSRKGSAERNRALALVASIIMLIGTTVWFTPIGQAIKQTVKQLVMTREVKQISPGEYEAIKERSEERTTPPSITFEFDSIPMGESIERTYSTEGFNIERVRKQTATALTLGEALQRYPIWSIPTYLAPRSNTRVIITTDEGRRAEEDTFELYDRSLWVKYNVQIRTRTYEVQYTTSYFERELNLDLMGRLPAYPVFPGTEVVMETVQINGKEATALNVNGRGWELKATHERGTIFVYSPDLPLAELVKIMESLPETE